MWRFLDGVSPPPIKKQKTKEEKLQTQRLYDAEKRTREFQVSWLDQFKWLRFDKNEMEMKCSVCSVYDTEGTFVTGCKNFKIQAIKKHDSSDSHQKNVVRQNAKNAQPGESTSEKVIQMMNKSAFNKLTYLFRNAHYVARYGRPYTDFVSLCKLDKAKGIDIGETYITDKYCQTFISAIADTVKLAQDEVISGCKYLSVISDGSTDTASREAEIILVRTAYKCQMRTHLMGIRNVPKADSDHISRAIINTMSERYSDSWRSKLVAVGCDGASVMLGSKSGVVQKLRVALDNQHIHAIHCSAHRLELAYKDAVKMSRSNTHNKCDALLLNLYLFYKYSSLNRANLMQSYKSLGMSSKIPTRVGGTRWLPHTKLAVTNLLYGYDAIVQHLEQLQNPCDAAHRKDSANKAKSFLKVLQDDQVKLWFHFLLDVVTCLSMTSEAIQKENSSLADIWTELESAKGILEKFKRSSGPQMKKLIAKKSDFDTLLKKSRDTFLEGLVQAITHRFEGDIHLFKGSSFINFSNWPTQLSEDIDDFGDSDIADCVEITGHVLKTANPDMNVDDIELEWSRFKTELYKSKKNIQSFSWPQLYGKMCDKYPNLLELVTYLLTLPSSSVDAERGFSRMKFVKNDWRSCLGDRHLSDLLIINTESPTVSEFDPEQAIHYWNTSGTRARRPFFNDEKKVTVSVEVVPEKPADDVVDAVVDAEEEVAADVFIMAEELESEQADDDDNELNASYRDIICMQKKAYKMMLELM